MQNFCYQLNLDTKVKTGSRISGFRFFIDTFQWNMFYRIYMIAKTFSG